MDDIPVYYNGEVYTVWESPIPNTPCILLFVDEDDIGHVSMSTTSSSYVWQAPHEGIYYRQVSCLVDPGTGKNEVIPLGFFQVYMHPPPQIEEETPPNTSEEIPKKQNESYTQGYMPPDYTKETARDIPEVLGTDTSWKRCNISLLKKEKYEILQWDCDLGIEVERTEYLNYKEYFSLQIEGTYPKDTFASIKIYDCKPFTLVDPQTWFSCKQRLIDWFKTDLQLIYTAQSVHFKNGKFTLLSRSFEDMSGKEFNFLFSIHFSHKWNEWIHGVYRHKGSIVIPETKRIEDKPFAFPLDRYVGVTQWYGCTAYKCPHGGIDFGAKLNEVLSVGDGTVVKVGYDKYGGECDQGGNFVIIKHTNGMYSLYYHLDSYSVKMTDTVKQGSIIGISGNSGKAGCKSLGYHLHFELRKGLGSSTHVNPVHYIDTDWNQIPTLNVDKYKKSLTGENPHPNF